MVESGSNVIATRNVTSFDGHQLRINSHLSSKASDLSLTYTSQFNDRGQYKTGKRAKSFEAVFKVLCPSKKESLIFHTENPNDTKVLKNASFVIPATIVDGFWLREHQDVKDALIEGAFDAHVSAQLRGQLQPYLDEMTAIAAKCFSNIRLEEIAVVKSGGLLGRKPTEFHVNLKKLTETFRKSFIAGTNPTLVNVLYCLGRHSGDLQPEWRNLIEKFAAPQSISREDMESVKWRERMSTLQETEWFTSERKANWKLIDEITEGGSKLHRFIEKLMKSRKYGLKKLQGKRGILTSDSTETKWRVASMVRLLHYYNVSLEYTTQKNA